MVWNIFFFKIKYKTGRRTYLQDFREQLKNLRKIGREHISNRLKEIQEENLFASDLLAEILKTHRNHFLNKIWLNIHPWKGDSLYLTLNSTFAKV